MNAKVVGVSQQAIHSVTKQDRGGEERLLLLHDP